MKKLLVMLVAVGLLATTANAATLWMQFEGGTNEVTLVPSETVNVEIWVDLLAGDALSTAFYPNWPDNGTDNAAYPSGVEGLDQDALSSPVNGWSVGTDMGTHLGDGTQQAAFGATDPGLFSISGPGSFLIGIQTIHQNEITQDVSTYFPDDGSEEFDFYPIMFGGVPGQNSKLLNAAGGAYTFAPSYAGGYAGYYTWGQGSSAADAGPFGATTDNPLIVHCIPEPASLSLLALGALAIVRRRR